jgi:GAF domain-containing protein
LKGVDVDDKQYAQLLRRTMTNLTKTVTQPSAVEPILRDVTGSCVELVTGSHCADVLVITGPHDYQSLAPTSDLARELDETQQRFGEGPCVNAASGHSIVRCDDLDDDPRWPRFAEAAVAAGVHSMLSFRLFTHDGAVAALNVAGPEPNCFDKEAEALCAMLATHAAVALIADEKERQFKDALANRDVIGQAKGQIMERFDVDPDRAFELLVKLSQETNTRVVDVAAKLVARGSHPQAAP